MSMKNLSVKEKADMLDNCKKATFLIEKQQFEGITSTEESELEYHLTICEMCREYKKQSSVITSFVKKIVGVGKSELKLDDRFKEELQKQINIKNNESSGKD